MEKIYRQGDIAFVAAEIPADAKEIDKIVLRKGENGGKHSLPPRKGVKKEDMPKVFKDKFGILYIRAPKGTKIVHKEHKSISLPPGTYQLLNQREVKGLVRD